MSSRFKPTGLHFPPVPQQGPQQMTIAAPINDAQLVCLVAAKFPDMSPRAAVEKAMEIVAEAVLQVPSLPAKINALQSLRASVAG